MNSKIITDNEGILNNVSLLRTTRSICPVCHRELKANIVRKNKKIILEKKCPEHGECSAVLSYYPQYFADLSDAYFTLMPDNLPRTILELNLTPKCNLDCPICSVMCSVGRISETMDLEDIKEIIQYNPEKEFILWGMEPTENPHIEDIIRLLRKNGKYPYLFTNGLKLADFELLRKLKEAGLSHIYLQFDGFDDNIYKALRHKNLLDNKLTVMKNMKQLGITISFNVTLAKGINEDQICKIIDYAVENDFIKQIGFLPLIKVGKADTYRNEIVPELHEFLGIIERETNGRINIDNLRIFQKLMYIVYRFAKFRRCFWFTLFILIRDKRNKSYRTLDEFIDFKKLDMVIDEYIKDVKVRSSLIKDLRLLLKLVKIFINIKAWFLVACFLEFLLKGKKLEAARLSKNILFITCTDFCDFYKMDLDMADKYCEEVLAIKNKDNKIIYKPTYRAMIDGTKENCAKFDYIK